MISSLALNRFRRLGLALLCLSVPACGLNEYESLMRDTQAREDVFRAEQKYLGPSVQIPTQKDKEDRDVPIASVFFRPPKGVESKPQAQRGIMWPYRASSNSDFIAVEMAFGDDSKDFSRTVLDSYGRADLSPGNPRQINAPELRTPMVFDNWEFSNEQKSYSVNILRGSTKPLAIVFICKKDRLESLRKVIELSLQSLGVDQNLNAARMRGDQKTPWKLQGQPSP